MSKRVLAVDDEPDVILLVRATLEPEGYKVQGASSGEECLRIVESDPPDVILLDVMMPGMNGAQVTTRLKSKPETSVLPIIMITALGDKKYIQAALFKYGVDYYIVKPFDPDDLIEKVRDAIKYRRFLD